MSTESAKNGKIAYTTAFKKLFFITLITAIVLFVSAGTLRWWNAWVFLIANFIVVAILTGVVFRDSPDLVEERATAFKKAKAWDKVIVPILVAVFPLLSMILSGLDKRFGWTNSITTIQSVIALAVMLSSNGLVFWAMKTNRFFSSHVRIQTDRGHKVVTDGPYAFVRHPGYTGTLIHGLAVPIFLGSAVALWVGVASACLFIVRTALEDRTLQAELSGYREYAEQVRFKLLPWVW